MWSSNVFAQYTFFRIPVKNIFPCIKYLFSLSKTWIPFVHLFLVIMKRRPSLSTLEWVTLVTCTRSRLDFFLTVTSHNSHAVVSCLWRHVWDSLFWHVGMRVSVTRLDFPNTRRVCVTVTWGACLTLLRTTFYGISQLTFLLFLKKTQCRFPLIAKVSHSLIRYFTFTLGWWGQQSGQSIYSALSVHFRWLVPSKAVSLFLLV